MCLDGSVFLDVLGIGIGGGGGGGDDGGGDDGGGGVVGDSGGKIGVDGADRLNKLTDADAWLKVRDGASSIDRKIVAIVVVLSVLCGHL